MSEIILLNKPFGIVSQFSGDIPENTLASLIINQPGFYPAGRLDKKSEGLLLLTNDGHLQHRLAHPKFAKFKRYWVQVEGQVYDADLHPLQIGLAPYQPARVKIISEPQIWPRTPPIRKRKQIPTSWIDMHIQEGKNHQIRHMTAAIGFPTLRLIRYQIGSIKLGGIQPGHWEKRRYE